MKTLTVELPDALFEEINQDAQARNLSASEIVRERLARKTGMAAETEVSSLWDRMKDLVFESNSLPVDFSARKSHLVGYGERAC